MSKTIDQVAKEHFGGVLSDMAKANGVTRQLLSRWKKKGWVISNGMIMRPYRQLVDAKGNAIHDEPDQEANTENKHNN